MYDIVIEFKDTNTFNNSTFIHEPSKIKQSTLYGSNEADTNTKR